MGPSQFDDTLTLSALILEIKNWDYPLSSIVLRIVLRKLDYSSSAGHYRCRCETENGASKQPGCIAKTYTTTPHSLQWPRVGAAHSGRSATAFLAHQLMDLKIVLQLHVAASPAGQTRTHRIQAPGGALSIAQRGLAFQADAPEIGP